MIASTINDNHHCMTKLHTGIKYCNHTNLYAFASSTRHAITEVLWFSLAHLVYDAETAPNRAIVTVHQIQLGSFQWLTQSGHLEGCTCSQHSKASHTTNICANSLEIPLCDICQELRIPVFISGAQGTWKFAVPLPGKSLIFKTLMGIKTNCSLELGLLCLSQLTLDIFFCMLLPQKCRIFSLNFEEIHREGIVEKQLELEA